MCRLHSPAPMSPCFASFHLSPVSLPLDLCCFFYRLSATSPPRPAHENRCAHVSCFRLPNRAGWGLLTSCHPSPARERTRSEIFLARLQINRAIPSDLTPVLFCAICAFCDQYCARADKQWIVQGLRTSRRNEKSQGRSSAPKNVGGS